jgi:hypothetical protein
MVSEIDAGIWPPYREFYVQSILFCTTSALRSLARINGSLERLESEPDAPDLHYLPRRILDELQNLVNQGGALSRYFWPARDKPVHLMRARELRGHYSVTDESPLKSRSLRNALEHFDERLDVYLQQQIVGYVLPEYVGPKPESNGVPTHIFRAFYTDLAIFQVLGEIFEVEPIADEIHRIHSAKARANQPSG